MSSYQNSLHISLHYFKNLPDFSKFTKAGKLQSDSPMFDLEEVQVDTKNKTNLTSLAEEMITPIKMDLTDKTFGKPEAQNPIFDAEKAFIIDDNTVHDKLSSSSAKEVENQDVDIKDNTPTLPITKQTDTIIDATNNQQKIDDQIDQQQPDKGLNIQNKKTHEMTLRTRKPIININKSDNVTSKKKVTFISNNTDIR